MTKKLLFLLFLFLILCGCGSQPGPVQLPAEDYGKAELKDLDYQSVLEKIASKNSFVLYIYSDTCGACMSFKPVLEEFIQERNVTIYAVAKSLIEKGSPLDKEVRLTPTVLIISGGKTVAQLDPNSGEHKDFFETSAGFASWFDVWIIKDANTRRSRIP